MANISNTVQTILQIISDLRGESSTNTDASRIRAVSRANQDFARRKFWKFYLLADQTMAGTGVANYTVGSATNPMRYKGLTELFVSSDASTEESERYEIVDFNRYKNLVNRNANYRCAYEWYDATNDLWKVHINPVPEATDTITYSFYWEPPVLTATTEDVVCPNPKIVALLASADIHQGEDEGDLADDEKNEAEQLIGEVVGLDNSPAVNQLYSVGAIENSIRSAGIGTY